MRDWAACAQTNEQNLSEEYSTLKRYLAMLSAFDHMTNSTVTVAKNGFPK